MIRQACAWILMGALVTGVAAPVLAQGTQPAPTQTAPAPAPAAKAPAKTEVAKTKPVTGTVKSASVESLVLVAGKDKKEWTFVLGKDTKITKGGKAVAAKDLTDKDSARVTYSEADGKMVAKTVKVKAAAKPKTQS